MTELDRGSADDPEYLGLGLGEFINLVSRPAPAPAAGSAAAVCISLAAALCAKVARLSTRQISDAADLVLVADQIRDRAALLSQTDAAGYGRVISAQRSSRELDTIDRRRLIVAALSEAAEVPSELAEIGAKLSYMAACLAEGGNPNLLGDAVTAALLAHAGVVSAHALVKINLEESPSDARLARTASAAQRSAACVARAQQMIES